MAKSKPVYHPIQRLGPRHIRFGECDATQDLRPHQPRFVSDPGLLMALALSKEIHGGVMTTAIIYSFADVADLTNLWLQGNNILDGAWLSISVGGTSSHTR